MVEAPGAIGVEADRRVGSDLATNQRDSRDVAGEIVADLQLEAAKALGESLRDFPNEAALGPFAEQCRQGHWQGRPAEQAARRHAGLPGFEIEKRRVEGRTR